jgi:predicted O-methyltransferase YrrM
MPTLDEMLGVPTDMVADEFYNRRPAWVQGDIGPLDARFLFRTALEVGVDTVVEIGTATGISTGLLCFAFDVARIVGLGSADYQVSSYDISPHFYADPSRRVGDAAREILSDELLAHIDFRNPAGALDANRDFGRDGVRFAFIDADHRHPWPTLDFLAMLDCLRPGATVVLHDINLPIVLPQWQDWGAKYLFDGLTIEKRVAAYEPVPNIGSVTVPADKQALRQQLLGILAAHPWQTQVPDDYLARLGVERPAS